MIKAIVFAIVGAGGMYLYLNPGDFEGMVEVGKEAVHEGASVVAEATSDSPMEKLEQLKKDYVGN